MNTVTTFRTFGTESEARTYRYEYGTGGWIFVPEPKADEYLQCILFPPEFTPSMIFHHVFTKGRTGNLIGSA